MVKFMQRPLYDSLYRVTGSEIRPYFLENRHFEGSYRFPYYIHPLAFIEYDEEKIYRNLEHLGWERSAKQLQLAQGHEGHVRRREKARHFRAGTLGQHRNVFQCPAVPQFQQFSFSRPLAHEQEVDVGRILQLAGSL